jgi:hypothetical protein
MSAKQIPWQSILDLFTEEIKSDRHSDVWKQFQDFDNEEEIIKLVYNFDIFRYFLKILCVYRNRDYNSRRLISENESTPGTQNLHLRQHRAQPKLQMKKKAATPTRSTKRLRRKERL